MCRLTREAKQKAYEEKLRNDGIDKEAEDRYLNTVREKIEKSAQIMFKDAESGRSRSVVLEYTVWDMHPKSEPWRLRVLRHHLDRLDEELPPRLSLRINELAWKSYHKCGKQLLIEWRV